MSGPSSKGRPVISKGLRFPFQVSVACWVDLLGYGRMIAQASFNPLHPKAKDALRRLRQFHKIVADHSARNFPTLVMNDGAVAYRDLSFRSRSVTHDFFMRAWDLFADIKAQDDRTFGCPGARVVLACGFRMRGRRAGIDVADIHFRSIVNRLQEGEITADQAVHEAASIHPKFDIVPQLQANFAFAKAYVAEQSGSQGGLPGSNFYVDLLLFEHLLLGLHWGKRWLGRQSRAWSYGNVFAGSCCIKTDRGVSARRSPRSS
jgi:hypothetical protein